MKIPLSKWLMLCLMAVMILPRAQAQCDFSLKTVTISTGWDPIANSVITVSSGNAAPDPMWKLVQSPVPPSGWTVNLGGPAWVIFPHSSWDLAGSTSSYINAFPTGLSVMDNWSLSTPEYIFEREFCVCDPTGGNNAQSISFNGNLNSDNWAKLEVDGPGLTSPQLLINQPFIYHPNNFVNPPNNGTATLSLTPGTYVLRLHMRNKESHMGVNLDGTLSGIGLLTDLECNGTGIITGVKYNDCDQSGDISAGDEPVSGITIELTNSSGTVIGTTTTDNNGYYYFGSLTPGTYSVTEVPGPGWTIVSPAGGTHANVSVGALSVVQLDFLNFNPDLCPKGQITGTKYNDCDESGDISGGDVLVPGITIELKDASGTVVATTVTDANGQFFFPNVLIGDYDVCEVVPAGWTAVDPATGTHANVSVTSGSTVYLTFLNHNPDQCPDPCNFELLINANVVDCRASFSYTVLGLPPGATLVSRTWTYGDGNSGTGLNPTHFYQSGPGFYTACLTITYSINGTLCTKTVCTEIHIEKACSDEPCEIEAEIGVKFNEEDCSYDFYTNFPSSGTAINDWYWDFGDGNTGSGSSPNHQYANPGVYTVCVTLFGKTSNGECCAKTFCITIEVDCTPRLRLAPPTGFKGRLKQSENQSGESEEGCADDVIITYTSNDCHFTFSATVIGIPAGYSVAGYNWNFGNGFSGQGSPVTHSFPAAGTYTVCVEVLLWDGEECCRIERCITVDVPNGCGGDHLPQPRLATPVDTPVASLFPNPTDGQLTLNLQTQEEAQATLEIIDLKGALIHQQVLGTTAAGNSVFNVQLDLAPGVYIARVKAGQLDLRERLVIQRP